MSTTPPGFDPNAPFDPTNVNDPRYDPSRDPRYDPRWQKAQQRFYRDQQRAQMNQGRAAARAQAAAWKAQAKANRDQWKLYWRSQRRTSIVGPLLLITIGVVFFLIHTNRISPFGFFSWYAHWWPMLLILIGGLRLIEWAIDRARAPQDAPPMRYNVGGGVVALVIFLACLGLATHAMDWHADHNGLQFFGFHGGDDMNHLFGQKHEEDAPAVVQEIAPGGSLTIDSPHGDVTITGTSDDGKVHLAVHKEVFTNADDVAVQRLRELTPTLDGGRDSLTLHVPSTQGGGADVTLLVPAATHVLLNSNRGDIHVTNMKAPLVVTANNGDVEVAAITGNVQVHVNNRHHDVSVRSVTGDVIVDGNGDSVTLTDIGGGAHVNGDFFSGGHIQHIGGAVGYHSSRSDISFAKLNGELQIDGSDLSASEAVGPMMINTRSRNISLDKVTGDIKISNNHGDVDVHGAQPIGSILIENQNGNVNVTLPEKSKFNLQAETSDGDTHSDFGGVKDDGRGSLSGAVNGGGAQVRINTSHGDINVTHNSSGPLPPPPPAPRITGFGSVGPSVPDAPIPPEAAAAISDAKEQASEAKETARQAAKDAMEQAREAMRVAKEKQKEAEQLARDAARSKN